MADTRHPFKFSFVMPVYNVENYLDETVESILNQTLDFEENCEIIFVNDGSPDNVEAVCLKYKERYPANIKYIKQKNMGVSTARNNGLDLAEGEFISFLDSDDLISADTLESVSKFFANHQNEVDVVAIKMHFFEAQTNPHILNYKFHKTRVIDIEKEYDNVQLSASSTFIRASAVKGKYKFDKRLTVAEDAVLINQIILKKMHYGVISSPTYFYRRRAIGSSAMNNSASDRLWYINTPKYAHKYLVKYAKDVTGYLPRYVKFLLMYDMQWRLKQESQDVLTKGELTAYKDTLLELLQDIDDDIILEQRHVSANQKLSILERKYGSKSNKLTESIYRKFQPPVWIEFIDTAKGLIKIEGHINFSLNSGYDLYLQLGDTVKKVTRVKRPKRTRSFLGEPEYDGGGFEVSFTLPTGKVKLTAFMKGEDGTISSPIALRRYSRIAPVKFAYRSGDGYILTNQGSSLSVEPRTLLVHMANELRWLLRICAGLKLRYAYDLFKERKTLPKAEGRKDTIRAVFIPLKAILMNLLTVFYRCSARFFAPFFKRPVWIVSDRTTAAGDNGEAFFRYVNERGDHYANVYFAVAKNSPDYKKLKEVGKVVVWGSVKYKLLVLLASKIISSHADDFVINPFGARRDDFVDLMRFDYVFLQHGITKDDISSWLNRYNKNIALFVTAAKPEYASLLGDDYGYREGQVVLTGFPRYDLLQNTPKRKIIVAPTWRKTLTDEANQRTGLRAYDPNFKKSEYFMFYQSLLSDERIVSKFTELDMTMEFYLHPSHAKQIKDYSGSERVKIMSMPYSYKKAFAEGTILVTDYSSVAFDFAYLKKPVVYAQFDRKAFFGGHLYEEGYFSYEDDGFGPVSYTYDDTVTDIVALVDEDGVMPKRYEKRLTDFFYKFDTNNSQRVYEAILALDKNKR